MPVKLKALKFFPPVEPKKGSFPVIRHWNEDVFCEVDEEISVHEDTWTDLQATFPDYFERLPDPPKPEIPYRPPQLFDPTTRGALTVSQVIERLKKTLEKYGDLPVFYDDMEYGTLPLKRVLDNPSEYAKSNYVVLSDRE